ncbi:MAG: pyridoxamine 5'-phosphate oxidase family protein [Actinomycetota bacterium]
MTSGDYSQSVPAAERTLRVLEVLAAAPEGLTTAQLLDEVEGSRSALYALLNTLKARDYVRSRDGRHRLGPSLWALLPDRPRELEMLMEAFAEERPALEESIALVWPRPGGPVVVAESQPDRPVRAVYRPGAVRPPDAPDSLVIAAGGPSDDAQLRRVRRKAAATSSTDELTEVAVPICADGVRPVAALLAGVPTQRAGSSALGQLDRHLRQMAARLSHRLGAPVYQPYGWAPAEPVGPSRDLTQSELGDFLSGLWGAQLACIRPDGTPHLVPLWYEWDGEAMWLAASPGSSWRGHIAENPRVSVTLDEPWPPLRRLFLSGRAEEVPPSEIPGGLEGLRRRLAVRYLGQGADRQPELSEIEGWAGVRITPDRIHGRQGLGPLTEAAS